MGRCCSHRIRRSVICLTYPPPPLIFAARTRSSASTCMSAHRQSVELPIALPRLRACWELSARAHQLSKRWSGEIGPVYTIISEAQMDRDSNTCSPSTLTSEAIVLLLVLEHHCRSRSNCLHADWSIMTRAQRFFTASAIVGTLWVLLVLDILPLPLVGEQAKGEILPAVRASPCYRHSPNTLADGHWFPLCSCLGGFSCLQARIFSS
jgi:hypothetical protein